MLMSRNCRNESMSDTFPLKSGRGLFEAVRSKRPGLGGNVLLGFSDNSNTAHTNLHHFRTADGIWPFGSEMSSTLGTGRTMLLRSRRGSF